MVGVTLVACFAGGAHAELVVVVNVGSPISQLSRQEVINIFMGRYRSMANGNPIQPLDAADNSVERKEFYWRLVGKNLAEINAYWARLTFSGKTKAPYRLAGPEQVLAELVQNKDAIGYMERYAIDERVKVVYSMPDDRVPFF